MKMKVINMLKNFMIFVITDKSGEYKFNVKRHEISATFTDKPNKEILPRLKEILLGDLLSTVPPHSDYTPQPVKELSHAEKLKLEKILGKKVEPKAFACYSTQEEYEQAMGLTM